MKYIIKKLWVDPMENRKADGYENFAVVDTLKEAESFVAKHQEMWGKEKCWSLYTPKPLYKIKAVKELNDIYTEEKR